MGTATAASPSPVDPAGAGEGAGEGLGLGVGLGAGDGDAGAVGVGTGVGVAVGVGDGLGGATTWKLNVPRSTCPSSATAVQRTVYVPGASGGRATRIVTCFGSAGSSPPLAIVAPAASRTSRELRSPTIASLNVATTSVGGGTLAPSAGDDSTSSAWPRAAPAARSQAKPGEGHGRADPPTDRSTAAEEC
jgi:hypothetical protein